MWYKIGWYQDGKREYVTVKDKEQMLLEVENKTIISDHVSIRVLVGFELDKDEDIKLTPENTL